MFGSAILEVGIGLVLVFLLVSLILTAVRETIEGWFRTRARDLERALSELLDDRDGEGLRGKLYNHPLVYALFPGAVKPAEMSASGKSDKWTGRNLPTYIPRETFSAALADLISKGHASDKVMTAYGALAAAAGGDPDRIRKGIENWYDASMDRASGWYKRRTQWILFWLGLAVAVLLNINAISMGQYLATHEAARGGMIELAQNISAETSGADAVDPSGAGGPADPDDRLARRLQLGVQATGLPIGWDSVEWRRVKAPFEGKKGLEWLLPALMLLIGYLIVAFAATLGAPFWFDVLGKFMVVRSTVKPREKSPDEASKDGGTGGSPTASGPPAGAGNANALPPTGPGVTSPPPDRAAGSDNPVIFG